MWYMIQPGAEEMLNADDIYQESLALARNSKDFADSTFSSYSECLKKCPRGEWAYRNVWHRYDWVTCYSLFQPESRQTLQLSSMITPLFGEQKRLGVKVHSPEQIEELGINTYGLVSKPMLPACN